MIGGFSNSLGGLRRPHLRRDLIRSLPPLGEVPPPGPDEGRPEDRLRRGRGLFGKPVAAPFVSRKSASHFPQRGQRRDRRANERRATRPRRVGSL